ncbi:MAG: helix-turn-helix transcriptional regulator, partial [Eubacteriales bacterium]|nr:helix-turn-helix transcriptional regulator [Eubacteriales bacterium]
QSNISRFESGNYNPSLGFINKIANALGRRISIKLNG